MPNRRECQALDSISPNFERGKYQKIIINDVVAKFGEKAKGNKIDQEKLNELTAFFKTEIIKALSTDYNIVDKPGNDVAQIQIAESICLKILDNKI